MSDPNLIEAVYSDALSLIAQGEPRDAVLGSLIDDYCELEVDEIRDEMADALRDALKQGIEREDIDPSWF